MAVGTEARAGVERVSRLAGCCGFRVDGPDGRVGYVAAVLPEALEVRVGLFARRTLTVPGEAVETISPRRRVVALREPPE